MLIQAATTRPNEEIDMNLTSESNDDFSDSANYVARLERSACSDAKRFEFSLRRLSRRRPRRQDEPGHYQLVAADGKVLVDHASLNHAIDEIWASAVRRFEGRL
jgi:hypothetical protein